MLNLRARAVPLFQKVRDEVQGKPVDGSRTPQSPASMTSVSSVSSRQSDDASGVRTATDVFVAMSTERAMDDARYTRSVVKQYVQTKLQHGRSKEEISFKLAEIERTLLVAMRDRDTVRLAQVATAFVSVRSEFHLKPSAVLARVIRSAQRRALIEAEAAAEAEQAQAQEVLPPPPYVTTPPVYMAASPLPVEDAPPEYTAEDPVVEDAGIVGPPLKA